MNLLIGLVVVTCLVMSELRAPVLATDMGPRLLAIMLAALSVPGLAMVQTFIVTRRCNRQAFDEPARQQAAKRLALCHCLVWMSVSLAIVWALRWPDVVRVNWNCNQFLLLDELVILTPILLSLMLSWAIFYDVQRLLVNEQTGDLTSTQDRTGGPTSLFGFPYRWLALGNRLEFVAIRFRMYVLMVLIPVAVTLLARDFTEYASRLPAALQTVFLAIGGLIFLAGFPFLMLLAWKSRPVENGLLHKRLLVVCRRLKIGVFDIRIWDTGQQVLNAVVAGILPGCRVILISDALAEQFPRKELMAVVRHEAGHIRLCHLPIRMLFILLPLVLAMLDQTNQLGIAAWLNEYFATWGLAPQHMATASIVVYFAYLVPTLSWLAQQMEFEADWFAVQTDPAPGLGASEDTDPLHLHDSMTLALARLAAHAPQQYERRTLLHPSLKSRMRHTAGLSRRVRRDRILGVQASALAARIRFRQSLVNGSIAVMVTACVLQSLLDWQIS